MCKPSYWNVFVNHTPVCLLIHHLINLVDESHPDIEETFQIYSSFTTNYLPAQQYESILIAASKVRGQTIRNMDRRERFETAIVRTPQNCLYSFANSYRKKETQGSLDSYNRYIMYERRAKNPDPFVTRGAYERAIAEAARRRYLGEIGSEEALRVFWSGYCDSLVGTGLSSVQIGI